MPVGAGFKPALSRCALILRAETMIPIKSEEPTLLKKGGFETRPYK
jgi:hypothetical protein